MNWKNLFFTTRIQKMRDGSETRVEDLNPFKAVATVTTLMFLIIFFIAMQPFKSVPTGTRGVITQFGAIKGIEPEGLLLLPPWQHLDIFSIRAEMVNVQDAEGATKDQQPVSEALTVRYSIQPDKVAEVFEKYSHDGDLSNYIETATLEAFKAVTAKYTAVELINNRAQMSIDINKALGDKISMYGAHVIGIDVRNFSFSKDYMAAINQKTTQEQLKLAADNKYLTVISEQKQKVAVAEAERDAKKAAADGDAYAQLAIAEAQAKALRVQNDALAQNKDVLELRRIEVEMQKAKQWDGKLPENMYSNAPMPLLDLSRK